MIKEIIINVGIANWIAGLILMMLSNASHIIAKTSYKRIGWKKYRMGYSMKEIKIVINLVDDETMKKKLRKRILYRRTSFVVLISTPILLIIGNLL